MIDRQGVRDITGLDDVALDELVAAGLPAVGEAAAQRFDRFEIVNLALYAGVGTSVAEQTIRYALRWMAEPPQSWFDEREWEFDVRVEGNEEAVTTGVRSWVALPRPELYGGSVVRMAAEPLGADADGRDAVVDGPGPVALSGLIRTRGEHRPLVSRTIREIAESFTAEPGRYRWTRLPESVQRHPELVLPHGYAPCISVSLDVARRLAAAGYQVRTRRGWLLGMLDLAHSWVEVVDDDGQVKTLDPAFVIIARDHAAVVHPDFADACMGSLLNRVLPTDHSADEPVTGASDSTGYLTPRARTAIRMTS
jgi:hypothetical protein